MGLFCLSFCFCFRCWSFIESCWFWCCFLYYKEQNFQNGWDSNTEPQDDSKLLSYEARIIQGDQKKLGPKLLSLLPLKTVKNWWNKLHFKIWTLTLDMSKFEIIQYTSFTLPTTLAKSPKTRVTGAPRGGGIFHIWRKKEIEHFDTLIIPYTDSLKIKGYLFRVEC